MKEKYDQFRKVGERKCQCGGNCGLTFKVKIGQHGRKFAVGCPIAAAAVVENQRQYSRKARKNQFERRCACIQNCGRIYLPSHTSQQTYAKDCPYRNNQPTQSLRTRVRDVKCIECAGMSWRRPPQGLEVCACDLCFAPEPALSIDEFATNAYLPERVF